VVRDQRRTRARELVEKRGLADVRPTHQRDDGQHQLVLRAARHAAPWAQASLSRSAYAATVPSSPCTNTASPTTSGAPVIRPPAARWRATSSPVTGSSQCR